jgi:macrolide transport system ATP-binding/permease protein
MFEVEDLSFTYTVEQRKIHVLQNLNFHVKRGEFVGIQGPSGSGKSTLFYILGFLLKPTDGRVIFDGIDICDLSGDDLTITRNRKIGFVFQQFHLLPNTSVLNNILLPTLYPSEYASPSEEKRKKATELAEQLGLGKHLTHHPNQLSGGQQQRVAIARALMNDVDLILADEPTGNLDSQNAKQILDLFTELNSQGKTIILITHDSEVAKRCSRVYHLKDGAFTRIEDQFKPPAAVDIPKKEKFSEDIRESSFSIYQRIARSVFPVAVENLFRNRIKSILTMLGVVIGIAAVLAMVTLGQFTKRKILETYEALGVNKLVLRGYSNWNLKATDSVSVHFKSFGWEKDFKSLQRVFPEIKAMSPVLSMWRSRVVAGGIQVEDKVTSLGISPDLISITNRKIQLGRNLSPFHVENRSPVCLIGFEIAQRLFQRTFPLQQVITVTDGGKVSFPCQVIGVLAPVTSNQEWSPPNLHILLPYTYFQTVTAGAWNSEIHEGAIQLVSGSDIEKSGKKLKAYFQQKYGNAGNFFVDSDSTLIAQMKKFLNLFGVLLASIALVSLGVGGIGINNMMLVSVTERLKEFGLRKALGATDRSIRVQVILESMVLCSVAGLIGVVLGFSVYELLIFGATQFVPKLKFEWVFEPIAMVLSLFSILAVGMISGLVPAIKAEKLQVIEALRSD